MIRQVIPHESKEEQPGGWDVHVFVSLCFCVFMCVSIPPSAHAHIAKLLCGFFFLYFITLPKSVSSYSFILTFLSCTFEVKGYFHFDCIRKSPPQAVIPPHDQTKLCHFEFRSEPGQIQRLHAPFTQLNGPKRFCVRNWDASLSQANWSNRSDTDISRLW